MTITMQNKNYYGKNKWIKRLHRWLQQLVVKSYFRIYEVTPPHRSQQYITAKQIYNAPRWAGVSGYYRLYNEQDFLAASVLSHLPFFDEIILLHDRTTTDNTPAIAQKLAAQYPDKIKYWVYPHAVFKLRTKEYKTLPPTHPESFVNYYNFALSKTSRQVVAKLDGDHIAITPAFANIADNIRNLDFMQNTFYTFGGLNLWYCDGMLQVDPTRIVGIGDHGFHTMRLEKNYYTKNIKTEDAYFAKKNRELKHAGIVFFHLKNMRSDISRHSRRGLSDASHQQRFKQRWLTTQPVLVDWHTFVARYRDDFLQKTATDIRTLPDPNVYLKDLLEKIPSIDTTRLLAAS